MTEQFEYYLSDVSGTIHKTDHSTVFNRLNTVSNYYWNNASNLNATALVLWHVLGTKNEIVTPQMLGLSRGFSFGVSLGPVCRMISGLSLELILKAIAKALGRSIPRHHDLNKLVTHVGIIITDDQKAILDVLTEYVVWMGRYPTPKALQNFEDANEKMDKLWIKSSSGEFSFSKLAEKRSINCGNYEIIWSDFSKRYWRVKNVVFEG